MESNFEKVIWYTFDIRFKLESLDGLDFLDQVRAWNGYDGYNLDYSKSVLTVHFRFWEKTSLGNRQEAFRNLTQAIEVLEMMQLYEISFRKPMVEGAYSLKIDLHYGYPYWRLAEKPESDDTSIFLQEENDLYRSGSRRRNMLRFEDEYRIYHDFGLPDPETVVRRIDYKGEPHTFFRSCGAIFS